MEHRHQQEREGQTGEQEDLLETCQKCKVQHRVQAVHAIDEGQGERTSPEGNLEHFGRVQQQVQRKDRAGCRVALAPDHRPAELRRTHQSFARSLAIQIGLEHLRLPKTNPNPIYFLVLPAERGAVQPMQVNQPQSKPRLQPASFADPSHQLSLPDASQSKHNKYRLLVRTYLSLESPLFSLPLLLLQNRTPQQGQQLLSVCQVQLDPCL